MLHRTASLHDSREAPNQTNVFVYQHSQGMLKNGFVLVHRRGRQGNVVDQKVWRLRIGQWGGLASRSQGFWDRQGKTNTIFLMTPTVSRLPSLSCKATKRRELTFESLVISLRTKISLSLALSGVYATGISHHHCTKHTNPDYLTLSPCFESLENDYKSNSTFRFAGECRYTRV